jgi:hypothetical protein
MNDTYKLGVCATLRYWIEEHLRRQAQTSDVVRIRQAERKVNDLVAVLDELERNERMAV